MTTAPGLADTYVKFLRQRSAKSFYLTPYGGNAGDALIRRGTEAALSELGIDQTVDPREAGVIVMPGGLVSLWPGVHARLWRELWRTFPDTEFVIGPSGLAGGSSYWADLIKRKGTPVTGVFARDPLSYEALQGANLPSRIAIGLAPDPALYLHHSDWLAAHRSAATEEYALLAFRHDQEALRNGKLLGMLRACLPARVYGRVASGAGHLGGRRAIRQARRGVAPELPVLVRDASKQDFEMFVETVRRAREVHTNRMHVMLLAAMLGKRVFAYPAAHDKLANMYDYALKDWADVTLVTAR